MSKGASASRREQRVIPLRDSLGSSSGHHSYLSSGDFSLWVIVATGLSLPYVVYRHYTIHARHVGAARQALRRRCVCTRLWGRKSANGLPMRTLSTRAQPRRPRRRSAAARVLGLGVVASMSSAHEGQGSLFEEGLCRCQAWMSPAHVESTRVRSRGQPVILGRSTSASTPPASASPLVWAMETRPRQGQASVAASSQSSPPGGARGAPDASGRGRRGGHGAASATRWRGPWEAHPRGRGRGQPETFDDIASSAQPGHARALGAALRYGSSWRPGARGSMP